MKKALLALAVAGAAVSAQADVSLSGHVNYSAGNTKDFTGDDGFDVLNNGASGSRFRIVASTEANGITYGARQELGLANRGGSPTGRVSQITIGGDFGQLSLGQGWESGDDIAELDFSGTYIAGSGAGGYNMGGTQTDNIDGGRDQRLRYDSPKLGGAINIAADFDEDDSFGISVLAGGDNWSAGVFSESDGDTAAESLGGSVAIKVAGFTAALQMGEADRNTDSDPKTDEGDVEYTGVILGYNVGKVSVAIHTESREESDATSVKVVDNTSKGISFNYRPTGGVELYAGYRTAESDIAGSTIYNGSNDGDGFVVGGRVKF
ncbi:porin [Eionea flava]